VACPTPAPQLVFQEDGRAVHEQTERRQRLEPERQEHVQAWRLHPAVEALPALRGVHCTVAVTMVSESGELPRFESPRELLKCLGLIPSEDASGERRRQGAITQAGNAQARRALVAGAGASRSPAKVSRPLPRRLARRPNILQDSSWKAQVRLCKRSRRLASRGKHAHVVTVALARELAGFMWAIARGVPVTS
jgi:transposase